MNILITGASSGIGESLARIAAKRRSNLVLVARRQDRLEEIKNELQNEYQIEVEVIVADLTDSKPRTQVIERINQGDIDVLINNAGFGSSGPFVELDLENELNEIDLNIRALVELSHHGANQMLKKNAGTIVNVSSVASYQPMTGNAVYGASKAFVTSFSHALREELASSSVKVLVVCPGPTRSEFFDRSNWVDSNKNDPLPGFMWQNTEEVAEAIFRGIDRQKSVLVPGVSNKIMAGISSSLPGSLTRKLTAVVAKGRRTR